MPDCLSSCAGYVSEIIVGDMGSTDRTAEIARAFGATVVELPAFGYADPARGIMAAKASQPWTLMLDADERMIPELFTQIAGWIRDETVNGVRLPWKNILFGRWLRHSGYWPELQLRLFRTGSVTWPLPDVHTGAEVHGRVLNAPLDPGAAVTHLNYDTIEQWFEKANRYTTLEVQAARNRDRPFRYRDLLFVPLSHFYERYLRSRGFLDGRQGLWVALLMATYGLQVELKRWEQMVNQSGGPLDEPGHPNQQDLASTTTRLPDAEIDSSTP